MTICTNPKYFRDLVEDFIKEYEKFAQDDTLEGIDSTPVSETLERLYAYRRAIKAKDYEYIRAQGFLINNLEEQGKLATQVFRQTFGSSFSFTWGSSQQPSKALFKKAEFVKGGVKIHYVHNGNYYSHVFSLTTDGRSTDSKKTFITVPGFRDFLDNYEVAERNKLSMELVLGNSVGSDFKLDEKYKDDNYLHGNVEHMKSMLKRLHVLGGERASDSEMEFHMELLERMSPSFFESLRIYVQEEAEKSGGVARPSRIDIKIKGAPTAIGNQQSEASIYMEEVWHSMTSGAIASDTPKAVKLRRQLEHLVELGRDQLTWESFLPEENDSIDKAAEEAFAKKLYSYIFDNPKKTNYEFLAKGIAEPVVAKALSKVQVREGKDTKSLLERFYDLIALVVDVLSGNIALKNKDTNVHDALINLAYEMGEINTRANQMIAEKPGIFARIFDLVLNNPDRVISNKLHEITDKSVKKLEGKSYEKMPDDLYGQTKWMAKTVGLSLVNPTYTKVMGAIASAHGLRPDGTIREIVSGLFATEPAQKVGEFLVLQAGYIDKLRNEQIGLTRDSVLSKFKEAPTRDIEEALTEVIADTDLASLFGKTSAAYDAGLVKTRIYDNATLRKLLSDKATLDKFIKEAKRALKDLDSTHYNWHKDQAVGLGIYMARHQGNPEQNLNAENIVRGIHSGHRKAPNKKVIKAVDELATLVALKNTADTQRDKVATLMKTEWEGVQHIADIVEGFKKNSDVTVFTKSKTNKIKGYTREVFDDSIIMEVALLDDKKSMEAQGFTFHGELAPKVGDKTKKPMALYVTDSASRPDRLRGGVRLNQLRSKGTTITDSYYKEDEGFSHSLIRERARRDINEIQRGAIERAKKMENGTYSFSETHFGVVPVINDTGKVVDYRYMMDKATKKDLLKQDTRISEVMARSFGSLLDKDMSSQHNNKVLGNLQKDMEENWEQGSKGKDGLTDFSLIGPESADPEMRKLYHMLPREFKEFIQNREDKTLAVRTSLKNMYFGYSQLSVMDIPGLQKITPKVLAKIIRFAETMWMELVQIAKTNILMKMPTVTLSNFLSNVIYLTMRGYDPISVITMQVDSFREIKRYNANVKRRQELLNQQRETIVALGRETLSDSRRKELERELTRSRGELKAVENKIEDSRIHELVQMGLDQSVEDISSYVTRDTNRISKFFDEKMEVLPSIARTGVDYLFLTKRTAPYKIVNEFLEITDLMSRDIQNTMEKRAEKRQANGQETLPNWWLEKQEEGYRSRQPLTGEERVQFLKEAEEFRRYELVEDYINYALPSSQFEEYLNKIGVLMFTKYVKRIQRIITKTGGRGPIKSALGLFGAGIMFELPTIHEQSFLVKDWYTDSIGPGNVFPIYSPIDILMNVLTPSLLKASTYDFSV